MNEKKILWCSMFHMCSAGSAGRTGGKYLHAAACVSREDASLRLTASNFFSDLWSFPRRRMAVLWFLLSASCGAAEARAVTCSSVASSPASVFIDGTLFYGLC